jgi:SAM-dependent methyltransferase
MRAVAPDRLAHHAPGVISDEVHRGFPAHGGRAAARALLARALWTKGGVRRLPGARELDDALARQRAEDLDWLCELSPLAPLYLLPTRRFVNALARQIRGLGVTRVLEVAAGDGFLARCLARAAPELELNATDSGAWSDPNARMTRAERRALRDVPGLALGENVQRLDAARAIRRYRPELVLCSWLPPGDMLDTLVRARVRYVLELGAGGGVTGSVYSWRFAHEFLEGELEQTARCRLDLRPRMALHSRATLYYGRTHPSYYEERVQPGDWLYQFRPPEARAR